MTAMAAVKIDVSVSKDERQTRCDLVTFDELPADVVHGDQLVVWYRVSAGYRPKSGDWIGLFQCGDEDDDDNCCVGGIYSYVSFQWAPKYPNIDKNIPRRRVVFNSDQIKVPHTYIQLLLMQYALQHDQRVKRSFTGIHINHVGYTRNAMNILITFFNWKQKYRQLFAQQKPQSIPKV